MNKPASSPKLSALAVSEWLLVLPIMLAWRKSEALRQDTIAMFASLRRHFAVAVLGTGALLAGAILLAVIAHIITD